MRDVLREPEHVDADVLVVDVRSRSEVVPVSRLVAEGTFSVVVVARTQDAMQAMKYLDVGALDVIWSGTPDAAVQARVRSAARHARPTSSEWTMLAHIAVSAARREVRRDGETIRLTPTEFRLLLTLMDAGGRTVSHAEIINRVWRGDNDADRHHLRVYIRQLREKLEREPSEPELILTDAGLGYRIAGLPPAAAAV